jgi:two-component system chemotaxis response regulator CheB
MSHLLVELANDAPPETEPALEKLMEIENRIAEGVFNVEDWWSLEQMSFPSGLNCPTCRSALYELKDQRVLRYRCRSGHAFSAQSLLSGQADAREAYLSSLFGALIEEATLAKRLRSEPLFAEDSQTAESLSNEWARRTRTVDVRSAGRKNLKIPRCDGSEVQKVRECGGRWIASFGEWTPDQ